MTKLLFIHSRAHVPPQAALSKQLQRTQTQKMPAGLKLSCRSP